MTSHFTLTIEESLLVEARRKASAENTSLNELFRKWLQEYVSDPHSGTSYQHLLGQLEYAVAGRHFARDELNALS
jgi:hypothetical protein